jgi:hypothetical protein
MGTAGFDAFVRSWDRKSRRDSMRWLAGGAFGGALTRLDSAVTVAKKRKSKKKNRKAPPCVPQDPVALCAASGGTKSDNCGRVVVCPCPAGKSSLSNYSCAKTCTTGADCPGADPPTGVCGCVYSSVEGPKYCLAPVQTCDRIPQVCTSTAQCPQGQFCAVTECPGDNRRCWPLCSAA